MKTVDAPRERYENKEKEIILVVEDNAIARGQIKSALEPDFKVIETVDGKEGILEARKIIPDLIVSDIVMEQVDGFELCRVLKNDVLTSHIPIILLTARVSEDSLLEGLGTGADDYIAKPFSSSLLLARVKNLIDLRHQSQLERTGRLTFESEPLQLSPIDEDFYTQLLYTLETHLADPDFNVEALCRRLGISQPSLYRKVHGMTGYSPVKLIRCYRLKRAAQLLQAGVGSVSEVAAKVGFPSLPYFCRCFKKQFKGLPSDFQVQTYSQEEFMHMPEADIADDSLKECVPDEGDEPAKDVILLIEDNDEARKYICRSLSTLYRVVAVGNCSEGISRAMDLIPDLIICDTSTPGNEDFQVCQQLKQEVTTSHIPIMLLTASASEEHIISGLNLGVDVYLIKPFNRRVLHARIKNLIERRRRLQLVRHREMTLMPSQIKESPVEREFINDLHKVMKKYYSDADLTVEQLAEKLYMSSASLYRKIKALSGQSPIDYLRNYRLDRAEELLKKNFGTITEVAFEVGFKNRTHFSRCFKEKFHQLPSTYTGTHRGKT